MARLSILIGLLLIGLIASAQGKQPKEYENSNTNVNTNTNTFGRRSNPNANANKNMFGRRGLPSKEEDVDFNAKDTERGLMNPGQDEPTTPASSSTTVNSGTTPAGGSKQARMPWRSASSKSKDAKIRATEEQRATLAAEIAREITSKFADDISDSAAAAITAAVTRIVTEENKKLDSPNRLAIRRNYNSNSNTNVNKFNPNKLYNKLAAETRAKLLRQQENIEDKEEDYDLDGEFDDEEVPSDPVDVPVPNNEEGTDDEEIPDLLVGDDDDDSELQSNVNINKNTNHFSQKVKPPGRRFTPGSKNSPSIRNSNKEAMRLAAILRAAGTNLARLGQNYNSNTNTNTNEFRRGNSGPDLSLKSNDWMRAYAEDNDPQIVRLPKRYGGNMNSNSNTNSRATRRSRNHNENSNSNYFRRLY